MSARDSIRKYVQLLADSWTPAHKTEQRVERLYGEVRAEVLREAADEISRAVGRNLAEYPSEPAMATRRLGMRAAQRLLEDLIEGAVEKDTREPEPLPFTEARAAFMQIGHTPSLQGLRTELHIDGHPPLVGRYIGAGMRKAEHQDGLLIIEPALVFEYAQPAEPGLCPPCKRGDCEDCMAVDHPDQPNLYGCLCRRRDVRGACPRPRTNPAEREPMGDDFGIPGSDD